MRPLLLEARAITVTPIVQDAHLAVRAGESVAILGPPEAAHLKLLRVLGLRDPPDGGALFWHGRLVTPPPTADLSMRLLWGRPPRLLEAVELAVRRQTELLLIGGAPPDLALLRLLHSLQQRGQSLVLATCVPEAALWCETIYQWKGSRIQLLSRRRS